MKKAKPDKTYLKITIKNKGAKPITFDIRELTSTCWDYIYYLERAIPSTIMSENELLESLMQNYFTCKLTHIELGIRPCEEMESIAKFIHKHQKRIFASDLLKEYNQALPEFRLNEV